MAFIWSVNELKGSYYFFLSSDSCKAIVKTSKNKNMELEVRTLLTLLTYVTYLR